MTTIEKLSPLITDPEWSEYVLSMLTDNELKNGNPTVDGLRRVVGIVYGDIIYSKTKILEVPNNDYEKCTAEHTLIVRRICDSETIEVSAVVDVRYRTTESPYNNYLVATADTRAEGKALRRLLKLSVITAEELSTSDEDEISSEEFINDNQISVLNIMCKRMNINAAQFISGFVKEKITDVKQIPYQTARLMMSDLGHYQRNMNEIKEDLIGYQVNWRETLNVQSKRKSKR